MGESEHVIKNYWIGMPKEKKFEQMMKDAKKMKKLMEDAFRKVDIDGSGFLERGEFVGQQTVPANGDEILNNHGVSHVEAIQEGIWKSITFFFFLDWFPDQGARQVVENKV